METITRSFEAELTVLKGKRAIQAIVNTSSVDRLQTVIDPLGCDVSHFNKTRSVLWQHGLDPLRTTVPIGQGWVKVRKTERDMIGETTFRSDKFSQDLFDAYEDGSIRGWSIKAGVREASPPTRAEIRARPELEGCETIYRKWDLIEYSATPTPGNSDCLTLLVQRGLITAPADFVPTKPNDADESKKVVRSAPYVEQVGDQWTCYQADGTRIAGYANEGDARDLVRAMGESRSFNAVLLRELARNNARIEEAEENLLAAIQLKLWGVI